MRRESALGVTVALPKHDKHSQPKMEVEATITGLFGGMAVKQIVFGPKNVMTGASDDIRRAIEVARPWPGASDRKAIRLRTALLIRVKATPVDKGKPVVRSSRGCDP